MSALATSGDADGDMLTAMLAALGQVVTLADDSSMDLITAFTGSGPAFVFRLIEAYAAAGERLGLSSGFADAGGRDLRRRDRAARRQRRKARRPRRAGREQGGTTQAGLDVLDEDGQLVALMTNVLRAARDRGRELADLARGEE